jgi:hypothetical protein
MINDNLFGMGSIIFNFNRENVKIYVTESSAFCGGYELHVSASCSNEKLKEVAKLEKKRTKRNNSSISNYDPAFTQLRFFLRTLGIPAERMDYPSRKMDKRASKGVKSISLNYHFQDPYLAYALGLDLTSFYGRNELPKTKEEILNREEHLKRVIKELDDLQFSNRQKAEQESKITEQDSQTIWEAKYKSLWIEKLEKARRQGIQYHVFATTKRVA